MDDQLFRVSHTKLRTFDQCRKKYWFQHVSGLPWPEEVESAPLLVGKAVHIGLRALCQTGNADDGRGEMKKYLAMPKNELVGPGTPEHDLVFTLYATGVAAHESIVAQASYPELETWVPSPRAGVTISCRIDRADRLGPLRWQVIEWKTGLYENDDGVDQQLDLGQIALRTTHQIPHEATVRAIGWNLRTGRRRERELDGDDAHATANRVIRLALKMKETTDFPASPGPLCRYCDWRPQCDDAARSQSGGDDWYDEE